MAFSCRGPQSNVIINVNWSADDVDKVDVGEVRKKVKDIVAAIQGGQSESEPTYGNYGMQFLYIIVPDKTLMVYRR